MSFFLKTNVKSIPVSKPNKSNKSNSGSNSGSGGAGTVYIENKIDWAQYDGDTVIIPNDLSVNNVSTNNVTIYNNLDVSNNIKANSGVFVGDVSTNNIITNKVISHGGIEGSYIYVTGNASIGGNEKVSGTLQVSGKSDLNNTSISGNLQVSNKALIQNASISNNLQVSGKSDLNNTSISGNLQVSNKALIQNASISGNLQVSNKALIQNASILSNLSVSGKTSLSSLYVSDKSELNNTSTNNLSVSGNSSLYNTDINGTLNVYSPNSYFFNDVWFSKNLTSYPSFDPDIMTGSGWAIKDESGLKHAYFDELTVRRFLEVPELRLNKITAQAGITWIAPGVGTIKQINSTSQFVLKLEEGEYGSFVKGDLCQGIFSFGSSSDASQDEDNGTGKLSIKGFTTVYFQVTSVSGSQNEIINYQLKDYQGNNISSGQRPVMSMVIVAVGNNLASNGNYYPNPNSLPGGVSYQYPERQNSLYLTKTYSRYLINRTSFVYDVSNIGMQFGDLTNLTIQGETMRGYSMYLNNIYMKGVIKEISEKSGETLEKVNFKGDWVSSKKYWKNDAVNYNGSFWIAANDSIPTGSTPSVADWYEYGKKGADGSIGPDGNGIANVQSQYYLSTSTGIMTGGQIRNDYPAWQNGKYLWTRQLITQTKSQDIIYSDWICQAGQKGADGSTGGPGPQGPSGPILRMRGIFAQGTTYYNDSNFVDVVLYNNNYYKANQTLEGDIPGSSSKWSLFNQFQNLATSVLLANQGYIDVLGSGRLFVGQTENGDGWEMTQGKIRHTVTGLELTSDGKLYDPEGIHIQVGKSYLGNHTNLLPDPFFEGRNPMWLKHNTISGFSGQYVESDYDWAFNKDLLHGKYCLQYKLGASTSIQRIQPEMPRLKLQPNRTYTLSINKWHSGTSLSSVDIVMRFYTAESGGTGTYTSKTFSITDKSQIPTISSYTFTTDATRVWMEFYINIKLATATSGQICYIDGFKLEESPVPTSMDAVGTYDLLKTGIDLQNRKIVATTDNFIIQNNSGIQTLYFDSEGNMSIKGIYNSNEVEINLQNIEKYMIPVTDSDWSGNAIQTWEEYTQTSEIGIREYHCYGSIDKYIDTWNPYYSGSKLIFPGTTESDYAYCHCLDVMMIDGTVKIGSSITGLQITGSSSSSTFSWFLAQSDIGLNQNAILLPFMRYIGYDSSERKYMFDTMRTPTRNGGKLHLINLDEMRSLVGKRITLCNNTNAMIWILLCGPSESQTRGYYTRDDWETQVYHNTDTVEVYGTAETFYKLGVGCAITFEYRQSMYQGNSADNGVDIVPNLVSISNQNVNQTFEKTIITNTNFSEGFGVDTYNFDDLISNGPLTMVVNNYYYNDDEENDENEND